MTEAREVQGEFRVAYELGLHARPAGRFVTAAGKFACEVFVARGEEWVSGKSVLSLLSLAASRGTVLRIRAVGPDAARAVETLGKLIEDPDLIEST